MILTKEKIYSFYHTFKNNAQKAVCHKKYDTALKFLTAVAHTAYTFYIGFRDDEIESLLQQFSEKVVKRPFKVTSTNRVVMYDTFSQDSQGLTMQYLDAIIAAGFELLYVTEFNLDDSRSKLIKQTLNEYDKAQIVTVAPSLKGIKRVQFIYDTIIGYSASKLFMHIHPSAVEAVSAFYALPKEITRYQINLTDHTYWVGAGCMDYIFDFRDYGASLSLEHRSFSKEQIFKLPYYPMMKATEFQGFPKEIEGKVKIFSGSSFYKIIDENDTFFKLNKAILDTNPNAVTLFAGGGDMTIIDSLIKKYHIEERFIPIGQRNDIFECYKHADIYLSTYPLFGGLMAQFAAHAGLPILALEKKTGGAVEEVICQKQCVQITLPTIEKVVAEATRLINDEQYRHERGELMRSCVVTQEQFNSSFKKAIGTNESPYKIDFEENVKLHYLNVDDKLKLMNANGDWQRTVFSQLGIHLLAHNPQLWIDGAKRRVKGSRLFKH